jgi:hypothetical protein
MERLATRRSLVATAAAMALVAFVLTAGPAFAAIDGLLNPASGRAGDWVELTTDFGVRPDAYASIAAAGPTPLWLQRADPNSLGNACDVRVGDLTWADGVGHARFQVPDVQPGLYWLLVTVQGGCWRFGAPTGSLTLTVLGAADAGPSPPLPIVGMGAVVVVVIAGLILGRRGRAARSRDIQRR